MTRILIVDDDTILCTMLAEQLQRKGYATGSAHTLEQGLSFVQGDSWDVVLLDVQMPDGNGLDALPDFIASPSQPEVIIITGQGAVDGAEKAIVSGAWSYIEKPQVIRDLTLHLTRALQYRAEKQRTRVQPVALKRSNIIGDSPAISRCYDDLAKASRSTVNVLLNGETGTGKEVFARAIHENSERASRNFVVVDCAALPANLMENALFGHVKGAFTGADRAQDGLIKHAHGGTLFLDEVGELSLEMQKTFLRVLQEHSCRPLGSDRENKSDFRLVSATNCDLEEMVAQGRFRKDLLYRLKGMVITLPPLRERKEDIRPLVHYWLGKLCKRYDRETKGMSPEFVEALFSYDWPGNIRELFQTLEQVFAGAIDVPTLFCIHLPREFRVRMARDGIRVEEKRRRGIRCTFSEEHFPSWRDFKAQVEEQYLQRLMRECDENVQKACRVSGLSRARLYQLLGKVRKQEKE